jgi:hypothetical protein
MTGNPDSRGEQRSSAVPTATPPVSPDIHDDAGRPGWISMTYLSLAVWVAFAVLYMVLRSLNYTAVDGADRSASVFHRGELYFHGNHHLLYPFNVWVCNGALALLGLRADDPVSYIHDTQMMNAFAGAGCVAAVLWIGTKLGKSRFLSLAAAIAYGVSRVPILHFTSPDSNAGRHS